MSHYALLCNSTFYDICLAAAHNEIGTWTLPRGDLKQGDKIAVWRTLDHTDKKRGIVMFGEVLEEARLRYELEGEEQFWKYPSSIPEKKRRVLIRYIGAQNLPLWYGSSPLLSTLSVSKGQGNKLYNITKEQWNTLIGLAGGWSSDVIDLVQGKRALRRNIKKFNIMAQSNPTLCRELIRQSSYFVFDPIEKLYGPSKFIAWTGITENLYLQGRKKGERLAKRRFCGNLTRTHIEKLLNKDFMPKMSENRYFVRWAEDVLGKDILKNISPNKWNFLGLDGLLMSDTTQQQNKNEEAKHHNGGQGYVHDPVFRKKIEMYAMQKATSYYKKHGWKVIDTSANHPYDLLCTKDSQNKYIEVKGTTKSGTKVIVTYNEVEHAKSNAGKCTLFILHNITVTKDSNGGYLATDGEENIIDPWIPLDDLLTPISYRYEVLPK